MKLFTDIIPSRFVSHHNRFIVECLLDGRTIRACLPNPGKLWELLFSDTTLTLINIPPSLKTPIQPGEFHSQN